jgi:hypothetical protein
MVDADEGLGAEVWLSDIKERPPCPSSKRRHAPSRVLRQLDVDLDNAVVLVAHL